MGDLLNAIIEAATDNKQSVSTILRQCLVLSYKLKNDTLKAWVERELNGYPSKDSLPSYRITNSIAKGLFLGPMGAQIDNQPIPPAMLEPEHRVFAETVYLVQTIASYELLASRDPGSRGAIIEWPPNLTAFYQAKFFEGRYALNRAWQDIAPSTVISLVDTVRTRILTLALELQKEVGEISSHSIVDIPESTVQSHVINIILGGNNVIAGSAQEILVGSAKVVTGEKESLRLILKKLGVPDSEWEKLPSVLSEESDFTKSSKSLGKKTIEWIAGAAKELSGEGVAIGREVIKEAILQYFGLRP